MTRRGFASKLPPELRQELDRMIVEGSCTVDDLWEYLKEQGVEVGRSSVHRHMQSVEEVAAEMRKAREVASALARELGPETAEGTIGQALIEVVQNVAFRAVLPQLSGGGEVLTPEDLHFLARSVKDLASAQKTDADRILRIRQETAKTAAAAAEKVAKAQGLSADTVKAITHAVLGVAA